MKMVLLVSMAALLLSGCGGKTLAEIKQECWTSVYEYMDFDLNTEIGRQSASALYEACVDGKVYNN